MIETKDTILKQGSADDGQDRYRNLWSCGEEFRYMFAEPSPTVVSFIKQKDDKIIAVEENRADNGETPTWRQDKKIGTRKDDVQMDFL